MISANELIRQINEEWYADLNFAYPNWYNFKGKGEYCRILRISLPSERHDLWKYYKNKVLTRWRTFK